MSETETHSGKLIKIQLSKIDTVESFCKGMCEKEGITSIPSYNQSWIETFKYDSKAASEYFILNNNIIYKMAEHLAGDDDSYFMKIYPNADGSLSFIGQFYNGGTCLDEMLSEALEEHINKENGQSI